MKSLLVTAFNPFGGDSTNSSMAVLEALPEKIGDIKTEKLLVPTVYNTCAEKAWQRAKEKGVAAILAMGQAGGRDAVTPEKKAVNMADAAMADNKGVVLNKAKLSEDGRDEYFSTLPVEKMAEAARRAGYVSYVSMSAGLFVCNSMLYGLLKRADDENSGIKCAFLHLPFAKEQGKDAFSMETRDLVRCVSEIIKSIF